MVATEMQALSADAADCGGTRGRSCLDLTQLQERLEEEIGRANRHHTPLCCLLVRLDEFHTLASAYGRELSESALLHSAEVLSSDLRRFDRVGRPTAEELIVLLPGAGLYEGEAVTRRALRRLHSIKVEVGRTRRALSLSVGIAEWRPQWSAQRLIDEARCAAGVLHHDHVRD